MLDLVEEHDLAVGALGVCGVLEGVEVLFECVDGFVFLVDYFPYNTIGPATDFLDNLVALKDVGFNFIVSFTHEWRG